MVLEVQIHLVNENPGKLAPFAVFHDTVLNCLQRDYKRRLTQRVAHFIEIKDNDSVAHIHVRGVGKYIQTALSDQLGG